MSIVYHMTTTYSLCIFFFTSSFYLICNDLHNPSARSEYDGIDKIVAGDGIGLHITHVGLTNIVSPTHYFLLNDVLWVLHMKKKITFCL